MGYINLQLLAVPFASNVKEHSKGDCPMLELRRQRRQKWPEIVQEMQDSGNPHMSEEDCIAWDALIAR